VEVRVGPEQQLQLIIHQQQEQVEEVVELGIINQVELVDRVVVELEQQVLIQALQELQILVEVLVVQVQLIQVL
tara:strand:+ start:544 stop:765 length:222 start_codon:yes stop_codon:yes gene_type:complete